MIPAPIPPLTGLGVLVTRPQPQAEQLCRRIVAAGGEAIAFPAIAIEPIELELSTPAAADSPHDIVVFASANAVRHGLAHVRRGANTLFAAIGPATAAALAAANAVVDLVPAASFDSEGLLISLRPFLEIRQSAQRVLIVRGRGGRELLRAEIDRSGMQVELLEVYRRTLPSVTAAQLQQLGDVWSDAGIGIVTATSVETLQNLLRLLPETLVDFLKATPLLTVSERISQAARLLGWQAECFVASGPDEDSLIGSLAAWHTRARAADC